MDIQVCIPNSIGGVFPHPPHHELYLVTDLIHSDRVTVGSDSHFHLPFPDGKERKQHVTIRLGG